MKTTIDKIKDLRKEFLDILKQFKNRENDILEDYCKQHAMFKQGDFLQYRSNNWYIKVDKIKARYHKEHDKIYIAYTGKIYENVTGQLVKTLYLNPETFPEENCTLIPVGNNNIII